MKNTLFALVATLAIASVASADYRTARPVTTPHYVHRPQIVQFAFPAPAFGTYGYPYQAPQFAAVVDADGVVRLIELRQLRGLQLAPQSYPVAPAVQVIPGR